MSTQINVTVDSGGLRRRDQQQRHALRLGKLESDNQRKVEAKAKQEREAAQPPADAVYGVPFATPSKREEPAGLRQPQMSVLAHAWQSQKFIESGLSPAGLGWTGNYDPGSQLYFYTHSTGLSGQSSVPVQQITLSQDLGSGSGNQITSVPSWSFSQPNLPTNGYVLNPSIVLYVWTTEYLGWSKVIAGPRTARVLDSNSSISVWLALPAGKKNILLVNFQRVARYSVNATTMHLYRTTISSNYNDGTIPQDIKDRLDQASLEAFYPGQTLTRFDEYTVKYYYDGQTVSDYEVYSFTAPQVELLNEYSLAASNVYVCSETAVRRLELSQRVQAFLDFVNPSEFPKQAEYFMAGTRIINGTPTLYQGVTLEVFADYLSNTHIEQINELSGKNGHARIFKQLNDIYPFVSSTLIKDVDATYKYTIVPDTSEGGNQYSDLDQAYAQNAPFYYKKGLTLADETTYKRINSATLQLSPGRPALTDIAQLFRGFDCDDPAYCRSMCLALGFTEADLTP